MALQQSRLSQIVAGLKSRDEESRERSGQELQHFVRTELREASSDQQPELMDNLIHCIFDLVNSTDVNEKKGGIIAIGKLCLCSNFASGNYFGIVTLLISMLDTFLV